MRLTTNAFFPACAADGRVYQKPISRYEQTPTPSQPTNMRRKLSARTSVSIENMNRFRYRKKRRNDGSCAMYPVEYTWIRKPTPVTTSTMTDDSGSSRNATFAEKSPTRIHV